MMRREREVQSWNNNEGDFSSKAGNDEKKLDYVPLTNTAINDIVKGA